MCKLLYRTLHPWKYETLKEFKYYVGIPGLVDTAYLHLEDGWLTIKARFGWDGASFIAIDTKTIMRGSLVHDALYCLIAMGLLDMKYRKAADQILRKINLEQGMSRFRAWYTYKAVRVGGGWSIKKKNYPDDEIIEV